MHMIHCSFQASTEPSTSPYSQDPSLYRAPVRFHASLGSVIQGIWFRLSGAMIKRKGASSPSRTGYTWVARVKCTP